MLYHVTSYCKRPILITSLNIFQSLSDMMICCLEYASCGTIVQLSISPDQRFSNHTKNVNCVIQIIKEPSVERSNLRTLFPRSSRTSNSVLQIPWWSGVLNIKTWFELVRNKALEWDFMRAWEGRGHPEEHNVISQINLSHWKQIITQSKDTAIC